MHAEIQVALKFVISFLYNKLPRRRVNLFGEELENALRDKFQGHWYPDKPFKGSAYRCLKITDPADPVLNRAARESGNPINDVIENLPADLAVWIDPGEVSYRMGEKGSVKILYSEKQNNINTEDINPDVRGFLSLDTITASMGGLSLSHNGYGGSSPLNGPITPPLPGQNGLPGGLQCPNILPGQTGHQGMNGIQSQNGVPGPISPPLPGHSPISTQQTPFQARQPPVVYTAATFAQTKFGSTKLKTNSKKSNRMSTTEFSNYIKQRAMQKSLQQQNNPMNGQNNFYKFYSGSSYPQQSSSNYNNYGKGGGTSPVNNDYGFGYSGPSPGAMTNSYNNQSNNMNNITDYFSDWSDTDLDANAFLHDILSSAGVGPTSGQKNMGRGLNNFGSDWLGSGQGHGLNANQFPEEGLGPDSRSSSTKSMSSGSESLPVGSQTSDGFNQRVLVAN